ncbi:TrkH family potassium uptake protein [Psychromarinibacter sp. S121]|uniref:TrkH family potassium uptake protein n=1 Tax=Psychromarinibacter sp. S121 TaxID=3415127 RepID=UPI003C7ECA33
MGFVLFVNGLVLVFFAFLMLVDAVLFGTTRDVFLEAATLAGFVGAGLCLASWNRITGLRRVHAFIITSSVWIMAAVAGALPLYFWDLTGIDAFFESMSGITTTGSTVMSGLDSTPRGIILWRAMLQAVGGIGFIVTAIAILPILRVGGMELFRTESSEKGERELRNATLFATATLTTYLVLMGLCALVYILGGMDLFDAVTHAMTTLSTGGYSGYDASFGHFDSGFLQWAATLFMLLGALPFAWYIRVVHRGTFRSEQVQLMIVSLLLVILPLALWVSTADHIAPWVALRLVAFNVVSVVTTTGYATTDYTTWGPVAVAVFFLLTAVGGCTGSTAGGAKAMRWILVARSVLVLIRRIHFPHIVGTVRYEGRPVEDRVIGSVVAFFMFFAVTFGVLSLVLAYLGLDLATATSGALTALANVGPGVGPLIGPAGNFASLSDPVKAVLAVGMFLGRLEMITVFVLLTPLFWREML